MIGAGRIGRIADNQSMIDALIWLIESQSYSDIAKNFAAKYADYNPTLHVNDVIDRLMILAQSR